MCVCVSVYGHVNRSSGAHGGQRHPIPLQLEWLAVVSLLLWVLGTKLASSAASGCRSLLYNTACLLWTQTSPPMCTSAPPGNKAVLSREGLQLSVISFRLLFHPTGFKISCSTGMMKNSLEVCCSECLLWDLHSLKSVSQTQHPGNPSVMAAIALLPTL